MQNLKSQPSNRRCPYHKQPPCQSLKSFPKTNPCNPNQATNQNMKNPNYQPTNQPNMQNPNYQPNNQICKTLTTNQPTNQPNMQNPDYQPTNQPTKYAKP